MKSHENLYLPESQSRPVYPVAHVQWNVPFTKDEQTPCVHGEA
jgi:hypothetical protein